MGTRAMSTIRTLVTATTASILTLAISASLSSGETPKPTETAPTKLPPAPAKLEQLLKTKPTIKPAPRPAPELTSPPLVPLASAAQLPKVEGRSTTNIGVLGETSAKGYAGVHGTSSHSGSPGVAAKNTATATQAMLAAGAVGVIAEATKGTGVYGVATDSGMGVFGEGGTNGGHGVVGRARHASAAGVAAEGTADGTALRVGRGAIRITEGPGTSFTRVRIDKTTTEWGCLPPHVIDTQAYCSGYVKLDHPLINGDANVSMFFTVEGVLGGDRNVMSVVHNPDTGKWLLLLPGVTSPRPIDPRDSMPVLHIMIVKH